MRRPHSIVLALLLAACGTSPAREPPNVIRPGADTGVTETPDSGLPNTCAGEACTSFDQQASCCCPSGFVCGASNSACECIPLPGTDASTPLPDSGSMMMEPDAGAPRVDGGFPDSGVPPNNSIPQYSGAQCPTITDGDNPAFASGGGNRRLLVQLPARPNGAPVIFTYHWWMGQPSKALFWTGLSGVGADNNVIIVSPYTHPSSGSQWYNSGDPAMNPDIRLFDDVLACLYRQYNVDLDRIWVTGHSMGGIFISYLILHRAHWIAAFAPLSGGLAGSGLYRTPTRQIPGLLVWGGPTDRYGNFSFDTANQFLSESLRADGSFVVHCVGTFGHQLPENPSMIWPFLRDHVRGQPSSWVNGIPPNTLPAWCSIPN